MRKTNLARLLARRVDGIFLSDCEQGEIGPDLFRQCLPDGAGGHDLQAPREHLPWRPIRPLDQGQEPAAYGRLLESAYHADHFTGAFKREAPCARRPMAYTENPRKMQCGNGADWNLRWCLTGNGLS
jgi:hypothetical protein